MKKIINGKKYDTETAKHVAEYWNGRSRRDFSYLYEDLYLKKTGEFFIHGDGGAMTRYHECCGNMYCEGEDIIPLTEKQAKSWCEKHMSAEEYEELFGEVEE